MGDIWDYLRNVGMVARRDAKTMRQVLERGDYPDWSTFSVRLLASALEGAAAIAISTADEGEKRADEAWDLSKALAEEDVS